MKHLWITTLQLSIEVKLDLEPFVIEELRLMPSQGLNYMSEYIPP